MNEMMDLIRFLRPSSVVCYFSTASLLFDHNALHFDRRFVGINIYINPDKYNFAS